MKNAWSRLRGKWELAFSVMPVVLLAATLKLIYHLLDFEVMPFSPLLSGLIAGNIFLLGFLISGVLIDYKEAEKLPGELAASLMSILDEVTHIYETKRLPVAKACLEHITDLTTALKDWFYKTEHTDALMDKLADLNGYLSELDERATSGSVSRIKGEQSSIRRLVIRARTIRGTSFVPSGYAIAEATNVSVIVGLLMSQFSTFYETVFLVGLITFMNTYMLVLIKRLDNPFDYYSARRGVDEVSLMPLDEVLRRSQALWRALEGKA